jgi:hypothetical protein
MELGNTVSFSEANSGSDGQEIPRLLTEPKASLQYSHDPATGPYPEPDGSNIHLPILFLYDPF